ncbi:3'-5' exonuclease [Moraxella boevrei]|uniref:3'-5' exonuclease n=1 Tax=Faucicola boevrei TaxID=346665 RepID=UPI003736AA5F
MNFPPILVFDIETIPDISIGKRLYPEIAELDDNNALSKMIELREAEAGNPFMPLPLHKIACLSVLWINNGKMTLKTLSLNEHSEQEILQTFFNSIEKLPTLVSWNGKGFDIPVMTYRALHYGLSAPKLFAETGGDMKYNNYINRYHDRHTDLMLKTAMSGTYQKLDVVATACGFAGKQAIDGYDVVPMVQAGDWQKLTTYCESDVLNTWLLYLRYLRLVGKMTFDESLAWEKYTHEYLQSIKNSDDTLRHATFLDAWEQLGDKVEKNENE